MKMRIEIRIDETTPEELSVLDGKEVDTLNEAFELLDEVNKKLLEENSKYMDMWSHVIVEGL